MSVIIETKQSLPETISVRCTGIFIHSPNPVYNAEGAKTQAIPYIIHPYNKIIDNGIEIKAEEYAVYKMSTADLMGVTFPSGATGAQIMSDLLWFNDNRETALLQVMTSEEISYLDTSKPKAVQI